MYEPTLPRDLQDAIRAVAADDVERAALAELVGGLAAEPLPPDELTARRHIRAMCEAGGAPVAPRVPARRRRGRNVRAVAASWIAAATVLGGAGVAAATGSLPGPIQHAVAGVTHAVGIEIPGATGHHAKPHGSDGATGGSSEHRGTQSGSGASDPATHEGTPGVSAPARGSGAPGVTTSPSTGAPSAGNGGTPASTPTTPGAPATGNGASADAPGHGATPPGQGGTPPGQVTNPGQGNAGHGANGNGNANGNANANGNGNNGNGNNGNGNNGNGKGKTAATGTATTTTVPPGQGGTPPGQQKKASGA